jgi:hypothetical protein
MKTDLVLTIGEYLALCCDVPKHVIPPGRDARHIPITAEDDVEPNIETHGCRCDRWGHPRSGCTDQKHEQLQCATVQDFANRESR